MTLNENARQQKIFNKNQNDRKCVISNLLYGNIEIHILSLSCFFKKNKKNNEKKTSMDDRWAKKKKNFQLSFVFERQLDFFVSGSIPIFVFHIFCSDFLLFFCEQWTVCRKVKMIQNATGSSTNIYRSSRTWINDISYFMGCDSHK